MGEQITGQNLKYDNIIGIFHGSTTAALPDLLGSFFYNHIIFLLHLLSLKHYKVISTISVGRQTLCPLL